VTTKNIKIRAPAYRRHRAQFSISVTVGFVGGVSRQRVACLTAGLKWVGAGAAGDGARLGVVKQNRVYIHLDDLPPQMMAFPTSMLTNVTDPAEKARKLLEDEL
jgi:hypothetical protein